MVPVTELLNTNTASAMSVQSYGLPRFAKEALSIRWALMKAGPTPIEFLSDVKTLTEREGDTAALADQIILSLRFFSIHGWPAEEQWVPWCFKNILNRPADEAGIAGHTRALIDEPKTRGQVAAGFIGCYEFTSKNENEIAVLELYAQFIKRPADESGVRHWAGEIAKGKTIDEIAAVFAVTA